jgi:catechol 2,3-dioxygenase-like lactoylglutathione lyase family enzyme
MKTLALLRVSLTVRDLDAMQTFYCAALGFTPTGSPRLADPALARLLGAARIWLLDLRRGRQILELAAFDPPGDDYPQERGSSDLLFQHVALVCDDIAAAYARLGRFAHAPISRNGPQDLPGGIVAYTFRDPEGHPLELIQFPTANPDSAGGIDHSAISVADVETSIAFYTQRLGFSVSSRQVNSGPGQDAMDDLNAVCADVVGLSPLQATPHVELLGYRTPKGRAGAARAPADVAATRLVLKVDGLADGARVALIHDPDGHALLLCKEAVLL